MKHYDVQRSQIKTTQYKNHKHIKICRLIVLWNWTTQIPYLTMMHIAQLAVMLGRL